MDKLREEKAGLDRRIEFVEEQLVTLAIKIDLERATFGRRIRVLQPASSATKSRRFWPFGD